MAEQTTKKRATRKAPPAKADVPGPQPENHAPTHQWAYRNSGKYMTCPCGAEQDVRLVDGKAARFYRMPPSDWAQSVAVCPNHAARVAPPPEEPTVAAPEPDLPMAPTVDWRPTETIPEDHYALEVPTRPEKSLRTLLEEQYPEAFAPEIIDGHDVEKAAEDVDLDIACSPVLPHRAQRDPLAGAGDTLIPVEVTPLGGGMYRVYYHEGPRDVDAESVKIMRARFLLQRGALSRALYQMDPDRRGRWMRLYRITWLPPAGSPLATITQSGSPITIKIEEGKAVDFVALMRTLSTPGAAVPEVCPSLQDGAE